MFSRLSLFAVSLLLFASLLCDAQTATCTNWKFFNGFSPSGINRWSTVVGSGSGQQSGAALAGYVRYSNDATKEYVDPNAAQVTLFSRRNAAGVTVGSYRDVNQYSHGLLLSGSGMATLDYPGAFETIIYGINYWGTMVGIYNLGGDFSQPYDGFKMWKNGSVTTIAYPGAMMTNPMSISDKGVIVGSYVKNGAQPPFPVHGFILANGVYQTLDYPNSSTSLNDINGSGVIVGTAASGGFIYTNGTFKDVKGSNFQVYTVDGINGYGYVTGSSSVGAFTAHCQ